MKKNLINKLLDTLSNADDKNSAGFQAFDEGVAKLKSELRKKIQVNTLDEVSDTLDKFKKNIDLEPLIEAVKQIQQDIVSQETELVSNINDRLEELRGELSDARGKNKDSVSSLENEIATITDQLNEVVNRKPIPFPDFLTPIKETEDRVNKLISTVQGDIQNVKKSDKSEELRKLIDDLDETIKKLRTDLMSRISERGGGSMNRQIFIGGADPLTKYTDINLKAGSNVTLTYANNNTTKKVDVTITSSGGGSSVAGTVRSIASTSVSSTVGATSGTDYVVLATAGVKVTMPTAVSNTNLYTIKNVAASSVLVQPDGVETIDTSANLILATQFTSVDLISDGVNWNIT